VKLRGYLVASACAWVFVAPATTFAAQPAVGSGSVPPSVVVAPNSGSAGQGVARQAVPSQVASSQGIGHQAVASQGSAIGTQNTANIVRAATPVRSVAAATLMDQSGEEEGPAPGASVPVVAGEPRDDEAQANAAPAQESKRGWLRQPRASEADKEEPKSTGDWSMSVLALVLLGGLAGGAVVMKMRRGAPAPWLPPAAVRVLTTTRLTPKASLITAEVHGRVLLLGVTDASVTELGWLDGNASAERSLQTGERESGEDSEDRATPVPANHNATRAGFGQVLGNVFRAGERKTKDVEFRGNPNVAALIAARDTRDVVSTNYSRATAGGERRSAPSARAEQEPPHVETQIAGLARRRR
jgi:flagellar biogenesis protein FliO